MKRIRFFALATASIISASALFAQQPPARPVQPAQPKAVVAPAHVEPVPAGGASKPVLGLTTDKQKASYGIGLNIGGQMHDSLTADDLDIQALARGLADALSDAKPALTSQELDTVMAEFHKQVMARAQDRAKTAGDKNKKEGEAFLAANKSKDGVKTTASGLQYKVLKSGTGATPAATDTATVNYKGTLLDGSTFDSSYDRGEPASFPVNRVIKGWTEALQLMKVGDKFQLFIPANLAYGEESPSPKIGPNSVLVFEVELLGVDKPTAAPAK